MSDYKMGWTEALRILQRDVDAHPAWGAGDIYDRLKALQGELSRPKRETGHPHGVYALTLPSGGSLRVLHVDETRIRTKDDANRFRGLRVDDVIVYPDDTIPEALKAYLHDEVLAPMRADIADRKPHPGERKMREAASIYGQGKLEPDVEYLKRFAHTLEARLHDLERHAYAGELPRAVPQHESADWALMVVKRLESLEAGKRGETAGYQDQNKRIAALELQTQESIPARIVSSAQSLQAVDAAQGRALNELEKRITEIRTGLEALRVLQTAEAKRIEVLERKLQAAEG